jgi:hypothetical protein
LSSLVIPTHATMVPNFLHLWDIPFSVVPYVHLGYHFRFTCRFNALPLPLLLFFLLIYSPPTLLSLPFLHPLFSHHFLGILCLDPQLHLKYFILLYLAKRSPPSCVTFIVFLHCPSFLTLLSFHPSSLQLSVLFPLNLTHFIRILYS